MLSNNLFVSFYSVNFLFFISTLSAYAFCIFNNVPFYNTNDKNNSSKLKTIAFNGTLSLVESIYLTNYFLSNNIVVYQANNGFQSMSNLFLYTMYVEFIYYFLHRIYHTRYLYRIIHKKHHETYDVYPIDAFYFSFIDTQSMFFSLGIPVYLLRMSFYEYFFVLYIYLTFAYISHSKILYDHHINHHKLMKYNYCMLIPYFDLLLKTYK
jgi:sterol desaturase/sphingolipid hydroxylase (fatty acid hydroxylase superfamily)